MKIINLSFKDHVYNWEIDNAEFGRLTLLVGASGVGKTQILRSIMKLKNIAEGKSFSGISWSIQFITLSDKKYFWEGEFENRGDLDFEDDEEEDVLSKPKILFEKIVCDGKEIVHREKGNIYFDGKKIIKLPQQQSAIYLLKEEDLISPASMAIKRIIFSDQSKSQDEPIMFRYFEAEKLVKKYSNVEKIRESTEDIRAKLYCAYKNANEIFLNIQERYIDIFPQVEQIKVAPIDPLGSNVPMPFLRDYPFVQIKESGVDKWIVQEKISSGMFRTLIHISELYLSSEGSVFLIDEFENSLGINCIDELTNDILQSGRNLQFILTSHHPYIINNIHFSNWKLVTRDLGVVKTHDISKYNFGRSKHDAFMQLLQLEEYKTGREA